MLGLTLAIVLAGCAPGAGLPEPATSPTQTTRAPEASFEPVPTLTVPVTAAAVPSVTLPPIEPMPAPTEVFIVNQREIAVTREGRQVRTVIFHPRGELVDGEWQLPPGTFPLILFSHGLRGSPEIYERSLRTLAAAGFVVAVPEYPFTSADAAEYNPVDLVNQPADASAVITAVLDLDTTEGDPLAGHLDPVRVAAMGHSAGGYTTMGLLSAARDVRVRAAVVLAGANLGNSFAGPAVPVLFVHGEDDPVVPYRHGRTAYDLVPWPKAFLTVIDAGHADYLNRGSPANGAVTATVLDFLRAALYGDAAAFERIPTGATVEEVTEFESTLDEPMDEPR